MTSSRISILLFIFTIILISGCSEEFPDQPHVNKPPKTFLWLYPDSTISEGVSRQRVRWWGEDADGVIKGYLFAAGKLATSNGQLASPDTITWRWTTRNDSLVAFPLLVRRDTFQVAVRAVDNSFTGTLPEGAIVRFSPFPYIDSNENSLPDEGEQLSVIAQATDQTGATLGMPLLNQPPSVAFAQNPNDPTVEMQQPDTTFTAATFSWVGTDPDGDQTVVAYEIALNDTTDPSNWFIVPGNVKLVSLVVPRTRSDNATGEVNADVYSGTFSSTRRLLGSIPHLKLDSANVFYIRARDIAGDASSTKRMPALGTPQRTWFVKKPRGNVLVINDYIKSDRAAALAFYQNVLSSPSSPLYPRFAQFEVLDIARGLTSAQKQENKIGSMVSPFIDPGFLYTLHLFDLVLWYTDEFPSLAVAQYPLFQYVRDPVHPGKVIFSTSFQSSSDPRGALKDFAPIDSVSSVDLLSVDQASGRRLIPMLGDTRITGGYKLYPDQNDVSGLYGNLMFRAPAIHSVFLRPIYRRADAKYIYHIQEDTVVPVRYIYTPTISDLNSIATRGSNIWTCGVNGAILQSTDGGATWLTRSSGVATKLNSIHFSDDVNGWIAGDAGTLLKSTDGGATWVNKSVGRLENITGVWFTSPSNGIAVGTNLSGRTDVRSLLIRTTDGGTSWTSPGSGTSKNINAITFADDQIGVAVGDSVLIRTTDGGASWQPAQNIPNRNMKSVRFLNSQIAVAVGVGGFSSSVLRTSDGGVTWADLSGFSGVRDLRSVYFLPTGLGWISGANGTTFRSSDGAGLVWTIAPTNITRTDGNGQYLNGISFSTSTNGIACGSAGVLLGSQDGGSNWFIATKGNLNVGVIDGPGVNGKRSFVFIGVPLHLMDNSSNAVSLLFERVISQEFGL